MTTWNGAIGLYTQWLAAGNVAAGTIRLRRHYLRNLALRHPETDPFKLTPDDLIAFMAMPGWSPETRKSARAAVRGFYGWAVRFEHVLRDPSIHLRAVTIPRAHPRPTPQTALDAALATAAPREVTMLMLAAYAGLRRGEVARVHTKDIVVEADGFSLRVHGKGGRVRLVPLHPELAERLAAVQLDQGEGFIFPGKINGHLSADRVGHLLAKHLGAGWTAHTLRHRFASRAYAVDRDLRAVQELLGHSKPETTARYTAVPDNALRKAVWGATA
ncbi:tyrosine-type recombinase/integrase [Kineococcus gypseus]|uniref:tyrosine-type recombinase/integrase n=1 Tax=Kineococcus gypseus TaxID=1637102 RepID=UPI003D7CDE03